MGGMSAVKYKIMPESPNTDLEIVKSEVKRAIEELGGIPNEAVEEPIAFGLKAIIISFAYPEENEVDDVGNKISEIGGVSSTEMIDYRRALG